MKNVKINNMQNQNHNRKDIFKNKRNVKPFFIIVIFCLMSFFSSCNFNKSKAQIQENKTEIPKDETQFTTEMTAQLQAYVEALPTVKNDSTKYLGWQSVVKDIYKQQNYQPIWVSKAVLSPKGKEMLEYLGNAEFVGLNKYLYQYTTLRQIADSALNMQPTVNFTLARQLEVGLTKAFIQMALHIDKGMFLDTTQGINTNYWSTKSNYPTLLQKAITDSVAKTIATLEPNNMMYKRYMDALRNFVAKNNISSTPITIRNPKTDSVGAVNDARQALIYHHYLADSLKMNDSAYFIALKHFQQENNLNGDGQIGANTVKALERDNSKKFQLLAINADRWRKEHILTLPKQYVWVNLPSFKVKIIDDDTVRLMKNTVIGKTVTKNETPILESAINQIVLWPTWSVPQSIVKHEMKSFKGYTVTNNGSYTSVVQPPGPKNALGAVKILFPNKYSVYMHDTPSKGLFNADFRAASHGCVRCQDALEIAACLMAMDSSLISYDSLKTLKNTKIETKVFRIKKPIAVYFRYFTAEADFDGTLKFYADVYGRDKDMINFIFNAKQPHQLTKTEIRERQIKDSIAAKKKQTDTLLAENQLKEKNVRTTYSLKADSASAKHDSLK